MNKKLVLTMSLMIVLAGISTSAFAIQPIKASYWYEAVYIKADGAVDPLGAPISTVDNVTYILTADIHNYSIAVERDNIVVDGAGYTVHGRVIGPYTPAGIYLSDRSNVTIKNVQIELFYYGVELYASSNNSIYGNSLTNCTYGIWLDYSSNNNSIYGNSILANDNYGIRLYEHSNDNKIFDNNITANKIDGIEIYYYSSNNRVYGNNLTGNSRYGIIVSVGSSDTTISENNIIANNGSGISADSNNITLNKNNITNNEAGIRLFQSSNSTISGNNIIANDWEGISLTNSSNIDICGNTIVANGNDGIDIDDYSTNNRIYGNKIITNGLEWLGSGIRLDFNSNDNAVYKNNIANNRHGIDLDLSSNNRVYDNNFINNSKQVSSFESTNAWDNGYPSGGNYWDDYDKLDTDGDGIGDTPYVIDADEQDRYPRVVPLGPIPVVWNEQFYPIELKSNSTIYRFRFYPSQKMIRFNVTGPDVTLGFCNLTLPNSLVQDLWQGSFAILVDGEQPITMNSGTDGTHMYIYITYLHSTHEVEIILEFPTGTSLLLILTVLSVAIILQKTAHNDKRATFAKRGRSWSAARWPVPKLRLNCSDSCFLVW